MAVQRCLTTLHTADANPANFITNSLYFDDGDDAATTLPLIATQLETRYNALLTYFPSALAQNGHEFQFYKLSDPKPRVPTYEETWNFASAPNAASLPSEVAIVMSFQGARASGVPQARRRGRIYFGPLGTAANTSGRPSTGLLNAVESFGNSLLSASDAGAWTWVAFSGVNGTGVDVTNGWVDNAFDSQRRRGVEWTARQTFP